MKVFKPTYKDKTTGETKTAQYWYIGFTDNRQIRHRLRAFTSKKSSERAALKIDELLSSCGILSPDLQKWIEEIPEFMRQRFIDYELIENRRISENIGKLLLTHLEDFCEGLAADGRKEYYKNQTKRHIETILAGCQFKIWSDIDGNKVKTFLAKSRGSDGYGERTYNSYLRAFKMFCAWLLREDRVAGSDPMKGHSLLKQTEFRKRRRALTLEEIQRLLEATEAAPERYNMTGHERALVYRLALQTGMRAGEIKSLTKASFDFEANPATVHVKPADTKGKRPADLILMKETVELLHEYLSNKEPQDKAFSMPHKSNTADMLQADLKDAEIPYTDDAGRDVDFHSLRHSFITNLARAGVHPSDAMALARHSTITLTMNFYTHTKRESLRKIINEQPDLTTGQNEGRKIA